MWFGEEMKGTPYSQNHPEIPTPAGEECSYCGTVITEWDSGDVLKGSEEMCYRHQECIVYSYQGSRWCRSEGAELRSAQHRRYHELQKLGHGLMRPRSCERRVLLEFNEYISEAELINNWRTEK